MPQCYRTQKFLQVTSVQSHRQLISITIQGAIMSHLYFLVVYFEQFSILWVVCLHIPLKPAENFIPFLLVKGPLSLDCLMFKLWWAGKAKEKLKQRNWEQGCEGADGVPAVIHGSTASRRNHRTTAWSSITASPGALTVAAKLSAALFSVSGKTHCLVGGTKGNLLSLSALPPAGCPGLVQTEQKPKQQLPVRWR